MVAMDIVGPFPESPAGNTHILVIADYFKRWTEAYALPNQEATSRTISIKACSLA